MREIHIDLSSDYYLQPPKVFGGYVGEHNESKLLVKLPDRMIRDDIDYYYFEFQTVLQEHITSPNVYKNTLSTNNEISIVLWEQLLPSAGNLKFCVNAIELGENDTVTIKGKTSVCTLNILESPTGEDVLIDPKSSKEELQKLIDSAFTEVKEGIQKGDKGDPGEKGEKGDPFTYSDFTPEQLAALKGEKGDKGDPGEKGEKGDKGLKGEKGDPFTYEDFTAEQLANLKGKDGTNGIDGYTPQKGIDYFTDEDIASLNIPSVDQTFNRESKNAQSGIAIDKYVTDNFSDIIIETSHSVNSPAEIDCCLKGQKIVGGNILGFEPQIVTGKNLCPTPEYNLENEYHVCVCVPNEDGTFNYTGLYVNGVQLPGVELSQGTYYFSASNSIFSLFVPSIQDSGGPTFLEPGTQFSIAVEKDTAYIVIWDMDNYETQERHTLENCWVQIEKGTEATPFVKYLTALYLPHNPTIHFSPTNPIKNRTFIGDGITIEETGTALHYAFAGGWNTAFSENSTQIEVGQEYIMRFDVTCTDQNNPSKWGFGVFSKKQYSSACNVAAKSLMTVKRGGTVYQYDPQSISYTVFPISNPMINGQRYIVELVFTSSYSGEVYFGMRSEGSTTSFDLWSCLFCKTESLPMLADQKINTNLLSIGNIYDSIDLATGQKNQQIMIDELSFEEEQLVVNNYDKALPSVPAYFVSGTLEDSDWIECVTPAAGTANYTLTQPLSKGYIVYATRPPVTEQLEFELPTVCTDEFEVYTSSDDNMVPYYQTSIDTKKSAKSYLKKILNTIISMGGNI